MLKGKREKNANDDGVDMLEAVKVGYVASK